jgi:hypothetical protein
MAYTKASLGAFHMKSAACFLVLAAGVYSAAPADEPPPAQPPAVQAPAAPSAASASDAKSTPSAPSGASDAKSAPSAPSGASDAKSAPGTPAAPAPKVDKSELANAGPTDAEIKQMRSRGYKPLTRNGTMVFCRAEGEIGTHFQRTRCSTLDELKQAELTGKEYVNSIQQQGSAVPFKGP